MAVKVIEDCSYEYKCHGTHQKPRSDVTKSKSSAIVHMSVEYPEAIVLDVLNLIYISHVFSHRQWRVYLGILA